MVWVGITIAERLCSNPWALKAQRYTDLMVEKDVSTVYGVEPNFKLEITATTINFLQEQGIWKMDWLVDISQIPISYKKLQSKKGNVNLNEIIENIPQRCHDAMLFVLVEDMRNTDFHIQSNTGTFFLFSLCIPNHMLGIND